MGGGERNFDGKVEALVVPAIGKAYLVRLDPDDGEEIRQLIGGWLEAIHIVAYGWHVYVDEEGKLEGLPNIPATRLARIAGRPDAYDVLHGLAVFLGNGPDGRETDVPPIVLDAARGLGLLP